MLGKVRSIIMCWNTTGVSFGPLDAGNDKQGKLPAGQTGETLLDEVVSMYPSGMFFTYGRDEELCLTMTCHLGLAEFYRMIIGLRSLSACTFTQRPFHVARILLQFDFNRFRELDLPGAAEKGDWLLESIVLPWMTLVETFSGLTHGAIVLLDARPLAHQILKTLESYGPGICSKWIGKDLAIVVLNPNEWNSHLCQWTLQLAEGKLGKAGHILLKERAALVENH